jgi:transglutaminase-like putative cysteine protease
MEKLVQSARGERSLRLRRVVEDIVRHVRDRDKLSQIAAIYDWFDRRYTFLPDPDDVELVRDPEAVLDDLERTGRFVGDCDDATVFLTAALRTIGVPVRIVRVAFKENGSYTHVFGVAFDQYKRPIIIDPVAGERSARMASRARRVG